MASKRRGRQLKARKPFQTIHLHKGEKRWSNRTVAREGHTISEASYAAARRRHAFEDLPKNPALSPQRIESILRAVFGVKDAEPVFKYIQINKTLRLYFDVCARTHYRFVEVSEHGAVKTSIKYSSVQTAMLCVDRIAWVEVSEEPMVG